MKVKRITFFILIIITSLSCFAQDYKINVEINDLKDTSIYLGYYYGDKTYVKDTVILDNKGKGVFEGDSLLNQGLYIVVMPNKTYFDIIIGDDQHFSVSTTSKALIGDLKVKGSDENQALKSFQNYMRKQDKKAKDIRTNLNKLDKNSDSIKIYQNELNDLSKEVKDFWDKTIKDNQGNMLNVLVNLMKNPEIPEYTVPENITNKDSARWFHSYNYNRKHYFDFIDFSDPRFLHTPMFHNKVESFFSRVLVQNPDTISNYIDQLLDKAKNNKEMYDYWLRYFLIKYQKSNIMGMDKVFLHISEEYIIKEEIDWLTKETIDKIKQETAKLRFNQIGNVAQDLKMETIDGEYAKLHDIKSKFTLVYFWEPHCGHCKKTTPKIHELYKQYTRDEFEIFAVYTQADKEEWTDYIFKNEFDDWINVWDNYNMTNFRFFYNINSTPSIYLLDENKKIIAKRISHETLKEILDIELNKNPDRSNK